MDREPSEGSPSSSSDSQRRARKRPLDDWDDGLPSLESSEASSHAPTQPDSPVPCSDGEGATCSRVLSLREEFYRTLEEDDCTDSDSSVKDSSFADECTDSEGSDEHSSCADDCTDSEGSDDHSSCADECIDSEVSDEDSSSEDDCIDYESSDEDSQSTAGFSTESRTSADSSSTSESEGSPEDWTPWKSRSKDEEAGQIALSTMERLNAQFTGQTLDFRLPCTATEDTACQIVDHLSAWNEFFCLASWQLQEMPGTSTKLSLAFFRDASWRYCSSRQLHLATLLVCELLKSHRCVSHVELDISLSKAHLQILSDALRVSPSITSVKLVFCGWINGEELATAALSLPCLRELEYSGYTQHPLTLVARLSSFLQTTTSLTALRLSKECPRRLSCEEFFRGLGQNCSLEELVLPSRLIAEAPPCAQAAFTEWLTNSVSLKSLTVASPGWEYVPLKCILEAILANRSIVIVVFDSPELDQSDVEFVSKIFEENEVLRSFKVSYNFDHYSTTPSFVRGCPDKADCDRCVKALIGNLTLEEVALPSDFWDEGQWKQLFEALPTKANLKKVTIKALRRAPLSLVDKLCTALKETGAVEKVSFSASFCEKQFDKRYACKAFSSVVMSASDENRAAIFGMLDRIPSLTHITCLYMHFDIVGGLDRVLSSVLATFLRKTRTLNTFTLTASRDMLLFDCQEGLMDGLVHNTSLRELGIEVEEARNDFSTFSKPLAHAISASKNISTVYLSGPGSGERAFFRELSTVIADNYTLLSVTVLGYKYSKFKRDWFKVWDTTRRNCGLLTNAADFARGARHDRRCGLALERMHSHPELVEEVARLEEVDEAEAASMVRGGLRSMEGLHEFMRLAGVVREQVLCHEREDGRTQLNALNEYCWKEVRRYLKLWDVKELTAEVP
ncbi:uncharacterized protein LOC144149853 isoform X4 [Haemaphysalis longicornis]